jgi:hypothetical protein
MSLVLGTVLWVLGVTAVVGIVAWVVDRSTAREERPRQERQGTARRE